MAVDDEFEEDDEEFEELEDPLGFSEPDPADFSALEEPPLESELLELGMLEDPLPLSRLSVR